MRHPRQRGRFRPQATQRGYVPFAGQSKYGLEPPGWRLGNWQTVIAKSGSLLWYKVHCQFILPAQHGRVTRAIGRANFDWMLTAKLEARDFPLPRPTRKISRQNNSKASVEVVSGTGMRKELTKLRKNARLFTISTKGQMSSKQSPV